MATPRTPVGLVPQHRPIRRNILNERSEFRPPVQNVYGCGPRGSNVAQSSYSRSPVNDQEDHVGTWQQGEILPTTPVQSFYGSGPRGARTSTFTNSRSSRLQDPPDVDLRLQEDNVEDRLHNETPPTTSRGGVDVLANEVAKLRSTVDFILESQQSMEKSLDELRLKVINLQEGLHGDNASQKRKRRTPLSLQVQFCLHHMYVQ